VENVSGAAGTIGVTPRRALAPDGYTVLWGMWGTNVGRRPPLYLGFDLSDRFRSRVALAVDAAVS